MDLEKVIREIYSALEAIEQDGTLYEEANFCVRQGALDAIEVGVLNRVEGLLAARGQAGSLVALKQRAETARARLEASDEGLFRRLRAGIRSGALRGTELQRQLQATAGDAQGRADDGYDSLDALVSGILFPASAPGVIAAMEPEMVPYQPTPVRLIFELVERAGLQEHDSFYDVGSGLGQVAILVHLLSGVVAKGVEVDPAYCEYARRCAQALELSRVEFIHADAREAEYSDGTAFFLYTPFGGKMLQAVLARLRGQAKRRRIDVYTYGPCTPEVARLEWLRPAGSNAHRTDRLAAFKSVGGDG